MSKVPNAGELGKVGIIVVDHGSSRVESNELLIRAADAFRARGKWNIVEPAHMELVQPTIADAFARCVEQGAQLVVVFPYFLSPGKHWNEDIPRLAAEAAAAHPGVGCLVTEPFGLHPLLLDAMEDRIQGCLEQAKRIPPANQG